jgi:hypothetical protein
MENEQAPYQSQIMNHGIAYGQIINLDIKKILSSYTQHDYQQLFQYFNQLIDEFYYTYMHEYIGNFKKRDKIPQHIEYVLRVADRKFFKISFQKSIQKCKDPFVALESTFEKIRNQDPYLFDFKPIFINQKTNSAFKRYIKRLALKVNQYIYNQKINNLQTNSILFLCDFNVQYLYKITSNVKAIILKNDTSHDDYYKEICKAYEIPVLYSSETYNDGELVYIDTHSSTNIYIEENDTPINQQFYHNMLSPNRTLDYDLDKRMIKFYAPMINDINLDFVLKGPFYSGIAPFRTEYLYITKGVVPSADELHDFFANVINQITDKEIFIRLPDFRPDRPTKYLNDEFVDVNSYNHYAELYYDFVTALAKTFKQHIVHLVLPMIRMRSEIFSWRSFIDSIFENENVALPQVGIMFETESQFEFYEEYDDIDFAIIGLNDYIEEFDHHYSRSENITKTKFIKKLSTELQIVHRFFRLKNVRHLIAGNVLSQPEILDRILKMGFREICLPIKDIERLEPIIKTFISAKDKYIGIHEQRKTKSMTSRKRK